MIQKEIILNIIVCYIFLWYEITGVNGASDKKLNLEGKFEYTQWASDVLWMSNGLLYEGPDFI